MSTSVRNNGRTVFVTFPKFRRGIPVTLGTISTKKTGQSHLIRPYPDWSWHSQSSCDGMTSVFRTQENSLLTNVVVEVRGTQNDCRDTFAYVADTMGYSLLVLDVRENRSWNIESNSMYPYPPYGFFHTNNVEFNLMDGILGMSLSPMDKGDRVLYYHSLASVRESWVPTSVLKDEEYFTSNPVSASKRFKTSEEARKAQSAAQAFDKNGILYFGMVDNSLSCWNHRNPFTRENIHEIQKDNVNLQFASGLKVVTNGDDEEEIWLITNRFQITMVDQLDPTETNFRILKGNLEELTRNTRCKHNTSITFPNRNSENENQQQQERPTNSGYGRK
ncbi:hypothetical protein RUM43_004805 [Polyplax serrata]|uniref:Uncharacterized protein n=1 Tax=Polyplax serrata TaxID=468196 RepID=A0AAN8XMI0_POLSC